MNIPSRLTSTEWSKSDLIFGAAGAAVALAIFFADELLYLLPILLLAALSYGGVRLYRIYERTIGASQRAYHNALANNKDTPPPPNNLNWVEHVVYRAKLMEAPKSAAPAAISHELRKEHELLCASSGHGKTQLIEWQVLQDLKSDNPPALLIIDSKPPHSQYRKSNLIERISKLALFHPDTGRLRDRLVIVDPAEKPALNVFHTSDKSEENIAILSEHLVYFLGELLESGISSAMEDLLRPIARLLITHEGSKLADLPKALQSRDDYVATIETMDKTFQDILLKELSAFDTNTHKGIRRRLVGFRTQAPQFDAMFNATTNTVDLTKAFNEGKIVLVSTDTSKLGDDASAVFGKFFIARALAAARRATRKPAYIIVDEAKPYTNEKIGTILRTLRSAETGLLLAYQEFEDVPVPLQAVVRTNTTLRFVGGGNADAARIFSADFDVSPEFIKKQTVDRRIPPQYTRFAFNIKGHSTASFEIPIGALDKEDRMDDGAYARLRERNRAALADVPPRPTGPRRSTSGATAEE